MAKKKNTEQEVPVEETEQTTQDAAQETAAEEAAPAEGVNPWEEKYNAEHEMLLRLAADHDNYRKRTAKEKEQSYGNGKADAVEKLLPVYDNLERALSQHTEDAAYKKGVEMTMTQLVSILAGLGVEIYGQVGDAFDPNLHNAVTHIDNPELGESTIAQVFQKGIKLGEKIVRFAMVQVAN